jgi:site-specific recombinase XerD
MAASYLIAKARNPQPRDLPSRGVCKRGARKSSHKLNLEMVERFRLWLVAQKYLDATRVRYYRLARKFCEHIQGQALRSVSPMDIGDFLTKTLPGRWSDSYISHAVCSLRSFFDFLYLGGVVDTVAPRFLRLRGRARALPRALTEAQVKRVLRVATNPRDHALVEFLYSTGCRVGEARMVRVEDIDFKRRTLPVVGKGRGRIVHLGVEAAKSLRAYLKDRRAGYLFQDKRDTQRGYITFSKDAWVGHWKEYRGGGEHARSRSKFFGSPSDLTYLQARRQLDAFFKDNKIELRRREPGRPMARTALGGVVRELGRLAGVGKIGPHMLRHSFATHLLNRGADIRSVMELLGHTYLSSTQIYTRMSDNDVRGAFHRFHPRG